MRTLKLTAVAVAALGIAACASTPPPELKTARAAYQQAATAPGANLATPGLNEAKRSLDRAEAAFADNGDEPETRDLAYVAQRKALIARSDASTAIAMQNRTAALAELESLKLQQQMALGQMSKEKQLTEQQLLGEREARAKADQRRMDALKKIKGLATKEDPRGLVVTLGGGVLFDTGKKELRTAARKTLDEVIGAMDIVTSLKDEGRNVLIIGYTDSVGDDEKNRVLSQNRADEVRSYMTTRGIPGDRVQAQGAGEKEPVGDNNTVKGRQANRRVEIILTEPSAQKGKLLPEKDKDKDKSGP